MSGSAPTLLDFFGQLPKGVQATLFKDPWTCQAILRALSPLGQQYALRLASAQSPLPAALVDAWVQPTREARTKHDLAISQLTSLGLLQARARDGGATSAPFELHAEFGAQLLLALRGGDAVGGTNNTCEGEDKNKPTLAQLEAHATRTWETVLQAVISPPRDLVALHMAGSSVQALLCKAGLLDEVEPAVEGASSTYQMGSGARRFLMQPVHEQVWRLMMGYMAIAEESGADSRDAVLSFLMRLGFLEQGVSYPAEVPDLSAAQVIVLRDLVTLGLVYMRKLNSRRYYTTPLAIRLLSCAAHAEAGPSQRGFLVLETNFRLYSYTDSPLWVEQHVESAVRAVPQLTTPASWGLALQAPGCATHSGRAAEPLSAQWDAAVWPRGPAEVADSAASTTQVQVISEFAELLYQLPNLVVAQVTRESVLRAIDSGVSTQQIVDFLERNAHPLMAALTPILPETVVDQMRLWAAERDRLRATPSRLYENFVSLAVFDEAEQYARDTGVHLFSRRQQIPKMCTLVVAADAHDRMRSFLKSLSQRQRGS